MKECTPAEATALFRPRDTFGMPLGPGQPASLLHALGERDDWEHLDVFGALLLDLYALFTKPGVRYVSGFFGPAERVLLDSGARIEFVPADFRRFVTIAEQFAPRVVATAVATPDADGWMSLSLHAGATVGRDAPRGRADPDRLLIVEANAQLPRTFGIAAEHAHRAARRRGRRARDRRPAAVHARRPGPDRQSSGPSPSTRATFVHRRLHARRPASARSRRRSSRCSPNATAATTASTREMFTTGLMHLHRAGKVTQRAQGTVRRVLGLHVRRSARTELYAWLDGNDDVRFLPVDIVNAPDIWSRRNHDVVSINGAIAVDLYGQVVADRIDGRQYSGIGGHEDFVAVVRAPSSRTGRWSACRPTAGAGDATVSRIVASDPGGRDRHDARATRSTS